MAGRLITRQELFHQLADTTLGKSLYVQRFVIRAAFELVDFRGLEEGNFLNDALMFAEVIREIERS